GRKNIGAAKCEKAGNELNQPGEDQKNWNGRGEVGGGKLSGNDRAGDPGAGCKPPQTERGGIGKCDECAIFEPYDFVCRYAAGDGSGPRPVFVFHDVGCLG